MKSNSKYLEWIIEYLLDMVDFVMFPFLISGDFSVWLLQQEIQWTDFFTFTEVSFIDVDLCA